MSAGESRHTNDVMLLNRVTPRLIYGVDSDVVVLAINLFQELGYSELWIGF